MYSTFKILCPKNSTTSQSDWKTKYCYCCCIVIVCVYICISYTSFTQHFTGKTSCCFVLVLYHKLTRSTFKSHFSLTQTVITEKMNCMYSNFKLCSSIMATAVTLTTTITPIFRTSDCIPEDQ